MKRLRSHLSYANVVATLALFLALAGGAAFAASKLAPNSVGTKQLKKSSVTTAKIRNGAVTGAKVKLSTLGKVPSASRADTATRAEDAAHATSADSAANADALQGSPASAFVKGGGQLLTARRELAAGESGVAILDVPGIASLSAACTAGTTYPKAAWTLRNTSGTAVDETLQWAEGVDGRVMAAGENLTLGPDEYTSSDTVQLASRATPSTVATLVLSFSRVGNTAASGCVMFAQVLLADA